MKKLWIAKDKTKILGEHAVCLFVGRRPRHNAAGVACQRVSPYLEGRWPLPACLGRDLAPGDVREAIVIGVTRFPKLGTQPGLSKWKPIKGKTDGKCPFAFDPTALRTTAPVTVTSVRYGRKKRVCPPPKLKAFSKKRRTAK